MSVIANTTAASAASPISILTHGHRKGIHGSSESSASSASQAPATTQGLLSSLLQSIEQVIGVSVTASAAAAPATATATTAAAGAPTVVAGAPTAGQTLGRNLNTTV